MAADEKRWRGTFLVLDDAPDLRGDIYRAWEEAGATVEIETDLVWAFETMRRGRYSIVLVPLAARGRIGPEELTVPEVMARWARLHAPNYTGRFLYYGETSEVGRIQGDDTPTLVLAGLAAEGDLERSMDAIDAMIARIRRKLRSGD